MLQTQGESATDTGESATDIGGECYRHKGECHKHRGRVLQTQRESATDRMRVTDMGECYRHRGRVLQTQEESATDTGGECYRQRGSRVPQTRVGGGHRRWLSQTQGVMSDTGSDVTNTSWGCH